MSELQKEIDEQARLLGASGKRELRLMAQVEQLKKQLAAVQVREVLLREAIEYASVVFADYLRTHLENGTDLEEKARKIRKHYSAMMDALDLPKDDSAIRELIAQAEKKEREHCILTLQVLADIIPWEQDDPRRGVLTSCIEFMRGVQKVDSVDSVEGGAS